MVKEKVTYKSPLHEMTQTTPTVLWNDSADMDELRYAIENGAVGATCNPVIAVGILIVVARENAIAGAVLTAFALFALLLLGSLRKIAVADHDFDAPGLQNPGGVTPVARTAKSPTRFLTDLLQQRVIACRSTDHYG